MSEMAWWGDAAPYSLARRRGDFKWLKGRVPGGGVGFLVQLLQLIFLPW